MAQNYSPRIVQDGLVLCLDASQNKSYPSSDLPIKDGLVMWMDAADDTTFSYSSGTTVSQWRDKSGFNYHMTPVSAGPTRNSFLNSRKTLTITNAQQIGNLSINLQTSANTVFVVSRLTGGANGRVLTAYYNNWLLGHWGGYVNQYYAEGWIAYAVNAADTTWRIYMGDWGSDSNDVANAYSNGTSITNQTTSQASSGPKGLGINSQGYEQSNCEAAEIIVFNRLLSATERKQVHTYLGQKWGILNTDRSIIDLSGNNNHGLLGNGTSSAMPTFNYYNKSMTYNKGTANTLVVTNATSLKNNSTTIELYMKFNSSIAANTGDYIQMGIGSGVGQFYFRNENPNLTWNWYPASSASSNLGYAISNFSTDRYYLVTLTGDSAGASKMYVDGIQVASAANVGSGITTWTTNDLTIGGYSWDGYSNSDIALTRIYNRVLSAAEISQNYEAIKSRFANTIVQQGLVLNLDAGNPYSYAGAGTTWYDVSGTGNNSTLSNGPTYNTDIGGNIAFDGVDDYADVTIANLTTTVTLDFWVKYTNLTSNMIFGFLLYDIYGYSGALGFNTANSDVYGLNSTQVTNLGIIGNWKHIVFVMRNDVSYTNNKIYVNGVVQTLSQVLGSESSKSFNSGNARISGWRNDSGYKLPGSIGSFKAYNRELSAVEVLQNYNATKGRFGL